MVTWIMGRDQYGNTHHDLGAHPRQELARRLGYSAKSAKKQYTDKKSGEVVHTGYVFGKTWITLYRVEPWEQPGP